MEQWLIEYAQLGDLRDPTVTGLAALAEQQQRCALQVVPAPTWVTLEVEIEPAATNRAGPDMNPVGATGADTDIDPDGAAEADAGADAAEAVTVAALVPHGSVTAVDGAARARCSVEADLIESAADVLAECRARILDRRELTGMELSPATQRSVGAAVRQAAVMELEQVTGTSTAEATTLLAVATCDAELRTMLLAALRRGQARWSQVKTFWERTTRAGLTAEQRLLVAYALFGTDPALACEERFDPDGQLDLDSVWMHHPYLAALAREIAACTGQDPEADAARRRRAYENRRVEIRLHDDGTGTLTLTGPAVTIAGIRHRLDVAARAVRAGGDERTLAQLRFDIAAALHLHGILDLPEIDVEGLDEVLSPERLAELIAVIHAQPKVHAQIIVPVDALKTGLPLCPACAGQIQPEAKSSGATTDIADPTSGPNQDHDDQDNQDNQDSQDSQDSQVSQDDDDLLDEDSPSTPWGHARRSTNPPPWATPPDAGPPPDDPPTDLEAAPAPESAAREPLPGREPSKPAFLDREPPGRGMVAELTGPHPMFLTPGHARELILLPGTTLHRLLTDPADGRLIERTITTYRPDVDMRRQVLAADLYSRAPGSRLTGRALQLDHVTPYGTPGGTTTETNLAALGTRTHHEKTIGHWKITIGTHRDLTFTTLLDQHRTTRVHNYNQYLRTAAPDDLAARRDLASQAIYAHEIEHQRRLHRTGDRAALRDQAWVTITHTDPHTGRTHTGPHPETPTLDHVLNIPTEDSDDEQK